MRYFHAFSRYASLRHMPLARAHMPIRAASVRVLAALMPYVFI